MPNDTNVNTRWSKRRIKCFHSTLMFFLISCYKLWDNFSFQFCIEFILTSAYLPILAVVHWEKLPECVGMYVFIFSLPLAERTRKAALLAASQCDRNDSCFSNSWLVKWCGRKDAHLSFNVILGCSTSFQMWFNLGKWFLKEGHQVLQRTFDSARRNAPAFGGKPHKATVQTLWSSWCAGFAAFCHKTAWLIWLNISDRVPKWYNLLGHKICIRLGVMLL